MCQSRDPRSSRQALARCEDCGSPLSSDDAPFGTCPECGFARDQEARAWEEYSAVILSEYADEYCDLD
jgi:hypothetical protein